MIVHNSLAINHNLIAIFIYLFYMYLKGIFFQFFILVSTREWTNTLDLCKCVIIQNNNNYCPEYLPE